MIRTLFCCSVYLAATTGIVVAQAPATSAPPPPAAPDAGGVPADVTAALQMPKGPDQNKALGAAATAWAQKDPVAAMTWTLQQPPDIFNQVSPTVSGTCGKTDGKATADLLVQNGTSNAWKCLHGVLVQWTLKDPATATPWCLQAPPLIRYESVFSVADGYCRKDPPAAGAWAAQLPSAEDRGYAIHGVALMWGRANLDAATAWTKTLKPDDMTIAAKTIALDWRFDKLTADETKSGLTAKQWLTQLGVADADQDAMLKTQFPSMYPADKK